MNENLNLVEILKDAPVGLELYSPLFGKCFLHGISEDKKYPITVKHKNENGCDICSNFAITGHYYHNVDGECLLFPSKYQRDWSKFKLNTLNIDDPVMVSDDSIWSFGFYRGDLKVSRLKGHNNGCEYKYIVPFKDFDPINLDNNINKSII